MALTVEQERVLEAVRALPLNAKKHEGKEYESLPDGPAELGDLLPQTGISALRPEIHGPVLFLVGDVNTALGRIGYQARIVETRRTAARQLYLWGIGRLYKAPGRTGAVTRAKFLAQTAHAEGLAFDLWYVRADGSLGEEKSWLPILQAQAPRLLDVYGMVWGGTFSRPDYPHFEEINWRRVP